ncbi:MAG TPA: RDD family protein, partial [Streptosporangiaceae bacterium]|nr:RDD family protein [Streptosporangiaceae bacterium]
SLAGDVLIDSDGGPARIHVTALVDRPATSPPPRAPSEPRHYYQGYKLANWWQRAGAHLIDWLPLVPGIVIWSVGNQNHLWYLVTIGVFTTFPIWFYNRWYRQGKTGQSWGKRAMGLGLIGMSGKNPIRGWEAAVRDLAHFLDFAIFYLGFLLPIVDPQRQTLADKVMRTVVIALTGPARTDPGR